MPQIEVTFDIDANGILNVTAQDRATKAQQSITITGSTNLDKGEIDRMISDAQRHAQEDAKAREEAEVRNQAEQTIYQTEKLLTDLGDKVPSDVKNDVQSKLTNLREAREAGDIERTRTNLQAVQEATYRLGELMYQQAEPPPGEAGHNGHGEAEGTPEEGEVIEAEYKAE